MNIIRKLFGCAPKHRADLVPFQDVGGEWRFHAINPGNHRTIFTSGEAFDSKSNAERACRDVAKTKFTVKDA